MTARLTTNEQELRALAGVVSEVRSDLPAQGLPLSLLRDLKDLAPCDALLCHGYDTALQQLWFAQQIPEEDGEEGPGDEDLFRPIGSTTGTARPAVTLTAPETCAAS